MELSEKELSELEERAKLRYVPKIPKEQLVHGEYYFGRCRNANIARWNADKQLFYHWRTKFTFTFIEAISCPEDEARFDVFVAERILTPTEMETVKEIDFASINT